MSTATLDATPDAARTEPAWRQRRTVDAPTRMLHTLLGLSFAGAWLTAESEAWRLVHTTLGWTVLGLAVARLLWGLAGPRGSRLSVRWRAIAALPRSLPGWLAAPFKVGPMHHGATALVVLALLLLAPLTSLSGWANEAAVWGGAGGGEWAEDLHEALANGLLALVLAHLALIALTSLLKREFTGRAMLTGRVPGRGPDLVTRNRPLLAALVLAVVLGFWGWQALGAPASAASPLAQTVRGWLGPLAPHAPA